MNYPFYEFSATDAVAFDFTSVGPNGSIQKGVRFDKIENRDRWNLGFGDVDPLTGEISDLARSNNGDMKTVLATVARTVLEFFAAHPQTVVVFMGSTPARTRLYQREINNNFDEISELFRIQGLAEREWQNYQADIRYDAFLVFPR
jgi:hypothetical protein